jgi:hypothetical protein
LAILGLLDERMLCAARLVCRRFRQVAVSHFRALHVDCTTMQHHPTVDFTRFAEVPHFAVSCGNETLLHIQGTPGLPPSSLTSMAFVSPEAQIVESLAHLMLLPRLRSLSLPAIERDLCNMLLLPLGLEELTLQRDSGWPGLPGGFRGLRDASPLTRYSRLSSLAIDATVGAGPSVGSLTCLSSLRSLELQSCCSPAGVMSTFTMLTSVTWIVAPVGGTRRSVFCGLQHLTKLSRLVVAYVAQRKGEVQDEELASIARLTGLTCLEMGCCRLPESLAGSSVLAPLTCLVSLALRCGPVGLSILSTLNVEALRRLSMFHVEGDVSVLQRATGLTHLEFSTSVYRNELQHGRVDNGEVFAPMLATMTGLRSLSLDLETYRYQALAKFQLSPALAVLTNLTELEYSGNFEGRTDLPAIASLPGLRKLELVYCVSFSDLPALQAMSGLTRLTLRGTCIGPEDLTRKVRAGFDAERLRRGWPRLKLRVCVNSPTSMALAC